MLKNSELKNMVLARVPGLIEAVYRNSAIIKDVLTMVETQAKDIALPLTPLWSVIIVLLEEGEKSILSYAKDGTAGLSEKFRGAVTPYRAIKENVIDFVRQSQKQAQEDELKQIITMVRNFPFYDLKEDLLQLRVTMFCHDRMLLDSTMPPEDFLEVAERILEAASQAVATARKQKLGLKKTQNTAISKAARRVERLAELLAKEQP
jgi:hypothetical protein